MNGSQSTPETPNSEEDEDSSFAMEVSVTPETYVALRKILDGDIEAAALEILNRV